MPLNFELLWNNYPTPKQYGHSQLFDYLGWEDLKDNPAYENTCAIRMSLCLIKSGVAFPGRMRIKKGPYKGHLIEPGQVHLTQLLMSPHILGKPEKLTIDTRDKVLEDRQGIVSFMGIPGYVVDGHLSGHIDLVRHGKFLFFFDTLKCADACYWNAAEYLFWEI